MPKGRGCVLACQCWLKQLRDGDRPLLPQARATSLRPTALGLCRGDSRQVDDPIGLLNQPAK
jgi:hypothetical protein